MEPEGSLSHSQVPATCPYPEPDRSSSCFHIPFPEDPSSAVREPDLYRLLAFQVPNLMSVFHCLDRTKVSVQVRGFLCERYVTQYILGWVIVSTSPNPPNWRTTPCRLSATDFSIYWPLPSVLEAVPPSANLRTRHAVVTGTGSVKLATVF